MEGIERNRKAKMSMISISVSTPGHRIRWNGHSSNQLLHVQRTAYRIPLEIITIRYTLFCPGNPGISLIINTTISDLNSASPIFFRVSSSSTNSSTSFRGNLSRSPATFSRVKTVCLLSNSVSRRWTILPSVLYTDCRRVLYTRARSICHRCHSDEEGSPIRDLTAVLGTSCVSTRDSFWSSARK